MRSESAPMVKVTDSSTVSVVSCGSCKELSGEDILDNDGRFRAL